MPNVSKADWNLPKTESGLQECLRLIAKFRAEGDLVELGNGLLELSFLVKWVRSNTNMAPFNRSQELAQEALDVFRQAGDERGQVRALLSVVPFSSPTTRDQMFQEADEIACRLGDERLLASVLAARARTLAMSNRAEAKILHLRTLEIFRRVGTPADVARCLFGLSIADGTSEEKRDYALEAAEVYRSEDMLDDSARCMSIAMMNAEEVTPISELEDLIRLGLKDATGAEKPSLMSHFYNKLALAAVEKGQLDDAGEYRQRAASLDDDGTTPLERWKSDIAMTKTIIAMGKTQGNKEAVKMFQEELKQLKANKPR